MKCVRDAAEHAGVPVPVKIVPTIVSVIVTTRLQILVEAGSFAHRLAKIGI